MGVQDPIIKQQVETIVRKLLKGVWRIWKNAVLAIYGILPTWGLAAWPQTWDELPVSPSTEITRMLLTAFCSWLWKFCNPPLHFLVQSAKVVGQAMSSGRFILISLLTFITLRPFYGRVQLTADRFESGKWKIMSEKRIGSMDAKRARVSIVITKHHKSPLPVPS